MIRFIEKPNLPVGAVKTVVCGEFCDELNEYFNSIAVERFVIEPNLQVDHAVKYHADMAVIHLGDNKILLDNQQLQLGETLKNKGLDVSCTVNSVKGEYPSDIALNFTIFNKVIMGKLDFADEKLLRLTDNFNKISVKQGYCKCSCLVVSENAIITDDESIYKVLLENNFDSILISKGDVSLPGHEYGFIGGASGKISKNEVLFFGDITKHRDYEKIADFIKKHGCEIISLDFPLTDFGGMIPLFEEL